MSSVISIYIIGLVTPCPHPLSLSIVRAYKGKRGKREGREREEGEEREREERRVSLREGDFTFRPSFRR